LEEEKLELGKKMEQLLCEQDQLLGKQDQEQLLGKQDQRDVDLIKKVTFSDEALCKEAELGDDSLFDGGADDATKDAAAEEIVDIPGCAKSSGSANPKSIEANNLDSQTLSVLHKEDLEGTEKNGKPDNGDEREEQQRMHETCGKQLFEHDKVQAMDQGAQQSTQKVCSSYEGEEAPKKQFVIVKEREHARDKRLASQGRPKEGTRLKVMSREASSIRAAWSRRGSRR